MPTFFIIDASSEAKHDPIVATLVAGPISRSTGARIRSSRSDHAWTFGNSQSPSRLLSVTIVAGYPCDLGRVVDNDDPAVTEPASRYARPMDRVEAAVAAPAERPTVTLRLTADAGLSAHDPSVRLVVTDTAVTFSPDERSGRVLIRDIAERILAERDLFAEAAELLDGWATASGIADRMTVAGTSYWYYVRLGQWMWLVDRLLDAAIIEVLLADVRPGGLDVDGGVAPGIMAAARAAASHHGLGFRAAEGAQEAPSEILDANDQPAGGAQARPAARAA